MIRRPHDPGSAVAELPLNRFNFGRGRFTVTEFQTFQSQLINIVYIQITIDMFLMLYMFTLILLYCY